MLFDWLFTKTATICATVLIVATIGFAAVVEVDSSNNQQQRQQEIIALCSKGTTYVQFENCVTNLLKQAG